MSADPLPRGRHGLSRDDVRAAQRERILAALVEVMAGRGYADTPVAAVLAAAGVSRETFYQLFSAKADAFAAALEATIHRLGAAVDGDAGPADDPRAWLDAALGRYLSALADAPAVARLFLIETYAAGPAAMRARLASQRQITDRVAEVFALTSPAQRLRAEAFTGTVIAMVTTRVIDPDLGPLAELRPTLLDAARRLLR